MRFLRKRVAERVEIEQMAIKLSMITGRKSREIVAWAREQAKVLPLTPLEVVDREYRRTMSEWHN